MASVDKMKTNLTAVEASKLLDQSTRGKIFEDGPYQYRIFVSYAPMAGAQAGMIITVTNTPDAIAGDLIGYALTRISIILRNYKEKFEVLPSKIWVDSFGHDINFLPLIGGSAKGEFLDIRNADNAKNMFGRFSMKDFVEKNNKVLNKLNKFIDQFASKFPSFELPVDLENLDMKQKAIFRQQVVKLITKNHPVKGKTYKPLPVKFNITDAKGESKVTYNQNSDDPLTVVYSAKISISADKSNLMVKAFSELHGAKYNDPLAAAADVARTIMTEHNAKLAAAIEKYFDTYSPVECKMNFSFQYGSYASGMGARD